MKPNRTSRLPFASALTGPGVAWVFVLSALVNVLFLTGPLFMMQIYDRVLPSGSLSTLAGLCIVLVVLYLGFGVFDALRQQILTLRAEEFAEAHDETAFAVNLDAAASGATDARAQAPEDVETVRSFLASPGFTALFDLPAIPFYFLAVLLLHPLLGVIVTIAGLALAALAMWNEQLSRTEAARAQPGLAGAIRILFGARREAESLKANGMVRETARYWKARQSDARRISFRGQEINGLFSSVTKTLRLAIQSGVLAAGAYLAVKGDLSPGAMIAASVVFSRALAPVEQVLTSWRPMLRAREALARIESWKTPAAEAPAGFQLPAPQRTLEAQQLSASPPGAARPLVRDVNFSLKAGDVLAIVGPSGAGKSCLARAIAGAWPVYGGSLKFDGADASQWPADALGAHIGYLGQTVDFVEGRVSDIIARFAKEAKDEDVLAAAEAAGAHDLILSFADGYSTFAGPGGHFLSGGQKQRVGLARAFYGNPFVAVLDEPAAHLDRDGERALLTAIDRRRKAGRITIFTSHDQRLLELATHMLVLEQGRMTMSGPREAVMKRLVQSKNEAQG